MRKQGECGIAVTNRKIAKYLVVGTIFFDDIDDMFDLVTQKSHRSILTAVLETVVCINLLGKSI